MSRRSFATLASLLLAAVATHLSYAWAVEKTYVELHDRTRGARPLAVMLSEDPTLGISRSCEDDATPPMTAGHLLRLLQIASVLPADAEYERDVPRELRQAFGLDGGIPVSYCESGIEILIRLAQAAGSASSPELDEQQVRTATTDYLVNVMAGEPDAVSQYAAAVDAQIENTVLRQPDPPGGYGWPLRAKSFSGESHARALQILFRQTGVDSSALDGTDEDETAARDVLIGTARAVAMAIDRDPKVQKARWWIQVVQGPEQYCTVLAFLAAVLLSFVGPFARDYDRFAGSSDERAAQLHNSRWLVRWAIGAMPALGFIGTIRGLGDALGKADMIVTAVTRIEQAAAIGDVSVTLAFAFTTTLVALVLALVAGFVEAWTESWELRLLARSSKPDKGSSGAENRGAGEVSGVKTMTQGEDQGQPPDAAAGG